MSGVIANNFGSLPVVFDHGEGARLFDTEGKEYIDFVAGIGVNCLGHNHPDLVATIQRQAARQIHISNYYNSKEGILFAEELLNAAKMDRIYFCNSGAEANEAAIKLARKYGWLKAQQEGAACRNVIVTLEKSFHGRTLATLKATGQEKFHVPCFEPYPEGFRYVKAGDYGALKEVFDNTVCAFLLECVQGEGGVNLVDKEWALAATDLTEAIRLNPEDTENYKARAEAYLNNGNYEASFEDVTTALKLDSKADVNDLVLQLLAAAPSAELVNRIASAYTLIK